MKRNIGRRTQTGFTVIEILIATSIFAVIMIAALLMYDQSNRVFKSGVEAADVQQNTRIAFDKLVADLRMAGFDYDRDGTPSVENAYQQPDEQIEYISNAAITVRANYDYNENPVATDHGREFIPGSPPGASGYESINFPVVTTGNDEIVTYALVSDDASKNTDTITFFVDAPDRKSHPEAGGRTENLVTITGVDLSNNNPPYTLERIALADSTVSVLPLIRYPIATNIRSMTFEYFEDQVGSSQLTDLAGDVIDPADYGSNVGGLGQFNPSASGVQIERQLRSKIQSIKLVLTGQTENPDPTYEDLNDTTIAPRHRKYRLESLIVPRNYGRHGFKEQDYVAPDAPTITRVCVGYCGVARVEWDQPPTGGAPEDYQVRFDTSNTGAFPSTPGVGITTFHNQQLPDASESYFFQVVAINSHGSAPSAIFPSGATGLPVLNDTKPELANTPVASTTTANKIRIDWTAPSDFDTGAAGGITCTSGTAPTGEDVPIEEFAGFSVSRSRLTGFDPDVAPSPGDPPNEPIYDATIQTSQLIIPITRAVRQLDETTATSTLMGPVNCVPYYYRIKTQENCIDADENNPADATRAQSSGWTTEIMGQSVSDLEPVAPGSLEVIDADSLCDPATGYCTVKLKWEKVRKDISMTGANFLSIGDYVVYRQTYEVDGTPKGSIVPINVTLADWDAGTADYSDPNYVIYTDTEAPFCQSPGNACNATSNKEVYNEFYVVARQCASPESGPSPTVKYPCAFTPVVVTETMSGVIEGTGEQTSPWLIQPTSQLTLEFDTTVASMEGVVVLPDLTRISLGSVTNNSIASFPWDASLPDGNVYKIQVVVTTTAGCRKIFEYYVESTATNCCLTPVNIDTRLLLEDGPGQRTRVRLQNRCAGDLTLTQIRIVWDSTNFLVATGAERLTEIAYPALLDPLGTCPTVVDSISNGVNTNSPLTLTPPAGARVLIPPDSSNAGVICYDSGDTANGSNDYEFEIRFNKSYDPLNPPVTQVCIYYIPDGGLAATQCQILPAASTSPGVCDTP